MAYGSSSIRGAMASRSMPDLERFAQDEASRLQAEISLLEQQVTQLGVQRPVPKVNCSATQTDAKDYAMVNQPTKVFKKLTFASPSDALNDVHPGESFKSHGQLMTSTPKPNISTTSYDESIVQNSSKFTSGPNTDEGKLSSASLRSKIKQATFDGSCSWLDNKAHFEACAEINNWSKQEKGLFLAVSLRGQAQGVFGNIVNRSHDYDELVGALEERFAPPNQTELYCVQLRERRQKASETLSELGQDIRRLANLAYPTAPSDLRETLSKEQFIDALISSDMRIRVKQARPVNLNDAIRHAVELEAYNRAEKKHIEGQGYLITTSEAVDKSDIKSSNFKLDEEMRSLQKTLAELQKSVQSLKQQSGSNNNRNQNNNNAGLRQGHVSFQRKYKCYDCGSEQHLRNRCSLNKDNKSRGQNNESGKQAEQHHAKHVAGKSSGLYLSCKINSIPTDCLVDTGATLSILSIRAWDTLSQASTMSLKPFKAAIFTASGNQVDVKGQVSMMVEISSIKCIAEMVVADIDVDAILGLDFLKANNCQLNLDEDTLSIKGKTCPLNIAGKIGCYRITVSETVEIPSRSEVIIQGKVHMPAFCSNDLAIVEPTDTSFLSGKGIIAKALVHADNIVPLRLINLGDETEKLYSGMYVANLSKVSAVKDMPDKGSKQQSCDTLPEHLKDLYVRTVEGLPMEQSKFIAKLLMKHASTFSESDDDLGWTGILRHRIITKEERPIKQPLRRFPQHMNEEADRQIEDMLRKDVIQTFTSPWASGIVMVTKKDGSKRFCVDYHKLNDVTPKDAYPLPRIDDSLDQLSGAEWFSCLDLNSGYWQVEVEESDRPKTAFVSRQGLFEFKVMPFGLCNGPATFERLMEIVLAGLNWQICLIYLDDVIVIGRDFDDMIKNLDTVLQRLHDAGLKLKPRKCQLFAKQVEFLGHVISCEGIQTDPKKIQAVKMWPRPETTHDVRSFVGFCSCYGRFIPKFAEISKPLHKLTEKGQAFVWTKACDTAFETLKNKLVAPPILAHPDFSKAFVLDTDASDQAIGAVLSQIIDGQERVIAYGSRTLTKSERPYCVTRKELLALVHFVKYYRHFLFGKTFTVRTDHGSL